MNELQTIDNKELSVDAVVKQFEIIDELYKRVLKIDIDYGKIPGTPKDTLLKPGAEKLNLLFKLVPKIEKEETVDLGNDHREIKMIIGLYHKITGEFYGHGTGSCSTMETKFRYREGKRICPECKKDNIIKGKKEYGGGWLCYKKTGGCGQKYKDGDQQIESQQIGRIENTDIADIYNTVRKMCYKRALVSVTINATGVSNIFTQDVEDFTETEITKKSFADEMQESDKLANAIQKEFNGEEILTVEDMKAKIKDATEYSKNYFNSMKYDLAQVYDFCKKYKFDFDLIEKEIKKL